MSQADWMGSAGVSMLLLAFVLNTLRYVGWKDLSYLLLNFAGAALACYASWLIGFMPFVILEGSWAAVAALGLARRIGNR